MKINFTKIKGKIAGTVLVSMAGIVGMSPVTAFAQVPAEEDQVCICETKCTEDEINSKCPVCSYDWTYCDAEVTTETETETTTEAKEEESYGPLTPSGNMTLVDDYGTTEAGGKQFITVTTKSGNYFYIIIDRDDNGSETVHFLNLVDESDLLALMDDDQVEEYMNKTGVGEDENATATDAKATTTDTSVKDTDETSTESEDKATDTKDTSTKKNKSGLIVIVLIVLGGGAGAYFYFTKMKNKKPTKSGVDPDADYNEDEDDYLDSLPDDVEDDIDVDDAEDFEVDDSEVDDSDDEE